MKALCPKPTSIVCELWDLSQGVDLSEHIRDALPAEGELNGMLRSLSTKLQLIIVLLAGRHSEILRLFPLFPALPFLFINFPDYLHLNAWHIIGAQ